MKEDRKPFGFPRTQLNILSALLLSTTVTCIAYGQDSTWIFTYPSAALVSVTVHCNVSPISNYYIYSYSLLSSGSSEQGVEDYYVDHASSILSIGSPLQWLGDPSGTRSSIMWGSRDSAADIVPGGQLSGFNFASPGTPSILTFYARGYRDIPVLEGEPDSTIGGDVFDNSFKGKTIAPKDPPTPFNGLGFLDTIKSYINESRTLGWITSDTTANKYKRLIDSAKANLAASPTRRGIAKAKLDSVLVNVYPDTTSGVLSSEAYALIRFNTEYLLTHLDDE